MVVVMAYFSIRNVKPNGFCPVIFNTQGCGLNQPVFHYGLNRLLVSDHIGGRIIACNMENDTINYDYIPGIAACKGVAVMHDDTILATSSTGNCVRRIHNDGRNEIIAGVAGRSGYTNGRATSSFFNTPESITTDGEGNIFICDRLNWAVRIVTRGGLANTVADSGNAILFDNILHQEKPIRLPFQLSYYSNDIYVSDVHHRILKISR